MSNLIKKEKNIWERNIIFYGFLFLYTACLIYLCYELNVWEDEIYTLNTSSLKLPDVISKSYSFEGQPPGYFIFLALWRNINSGIFFARLFSVASIGTAAFFFYRVICLISDKSRSKWLVAIFLLNPFTVWAGLEIRLYAFLILLSLISIYYFTRFYAGNKRRDLYIFLIVSAVGVYTQYFFTLQIAAFAFSLLVFKGWRAFFKFCIYLVPVVLLFLPNLIYLPAQLHMHQYHLTQYSPVQRFSAILRTPQDFLLALQLVPFGKWIRWAVKTAFIIGVIYAYIRGFKYNRIVNNRYFELFNMLVLSVVFLVILYGVILAISDVVYISRYMATGLPFFILLFTIFKQYSALISRLLYGSICLYFILLMLLFYKNPVKDYDFKLLAKHINKIEHPGEPILFYDRITSVPFKYYYTGTNAIKPLPDSVDFENSAPQNIRDTIELKKALEKINTRSNSYLLITNDIDPVELNINMNRGVIDNYLKINFVTSLDTLFFGRSKTRYLRIRRLKAK